MSSAVCPKDKALSAKLVSCPWPHLIVDNFLPESVLARSIAEINSDPHSFDLGKRGSGRIEYSLLRSKTLWTALYSRKTINLLSAAFEVQVALSRENWIQLRQMNSDTPAFPLHNDFVPPEDSIVSLLYLNSGWKMEFGGRLHLFTSEDENTLASSVAPLQNRFVAFRTLENHWHSIEKVCGWERLSALAMWDVR
jgi:hypothetical protein